MPTPIIQAIDGAADATRAVKLRPQTKTARGTSTIRRALPTWEPHLAEALPLGVLTQMETGTGATAVEAAARLVLRASC